MPIIPKPEVNYERAYYRDGKKPDTEKMKGDAAVGGGKGKTESYNPGGNPQRHGEVTTYSNGNTVTVWDCEHADGTVTKVTSIKIGNKEYIDWESDGKIDCVDTKKVVKEKKDNVKEQQQQLGIDPSKTPGMGI